MKTPKTPAHPASDEGAADELEEDLSSDDNLTGDADGAGDGQITHLGSDLPSVPTRFGKAQTSHPPSNHDPALQSDYSPESDEVETIMGANNSREDIQAALRATGAELQGRNTARPSNGRLKRPSTGAAKSTARPVPVSQRRMEPSNVRRDPYDLSLIHI